MTALAKLANDKTMAKGNSLKFEEALESLEIIVRKMEAGDLTLDESLKIFEEGMDLTKFCEQKLKEAQAKVETILKDKAQDKP